MHHSRIARLVVYRAIAQLQQLVGQHARRICRDERFGVNLQQHIPLQPAISRLRFLVQLHGDFFADAVWKGQIVACFHADAYVTQQTVDCLLRPFTGLIRPHRRAVTLVRQKKHIAVHRYRAP